MVTIPVVYLSFKDDVPSGEDGCYWDQQMVRDLLANKLWRTGYDFETVPQATEGAVVVFPARNQAAYVSELNAYLRNLKWVVLFVTGDEESRFPTEEIKHPNIRIWVMSPRVGRHDKYTPLGTGYAPHKLAKRAPDKTLNWFFAGQVTHFRREQMAEEIVKVPGGELITTKVFTTGIKPDKYFEKMSSAKTAPCPSGPETPDTFRLFEALECACVPLADTRVNKGDFPDTYWDWFFGETPPFPRIRYYIDLPRHTQTALKEYPELNNRVFAWWQRKKKEMADTLSKQIHELSGVEPVKPKVTVLMPSSPTTMHPSTEHIEQTIKDVRSQIDADIFIMLDGVRPEQKRLTKQYEEYQRKLLWLTNQMDNVLPIRFDEFHHQSGMTTKTLEMVTTPLILFVEHDTPLTPDLPIEWDKLIQLIENGDANVIRFYPEKLILPDHEHLMLGRTEDVGGVPLRKTFQWSNRPHLSSTAFYRRLLDTYFRPEATAFIEHGLYGPLHEDVKLNGITGWYFWRTFIYVPEGVQRSYDLNSRGSEPNYDSLF